MKTVKHTLLVILLPLLVVLAACNSGNTSHEQAGTANAHAKAEPNPAAPGFNAAKSDQAAVKLADEVMEALGGRKQWDDTRYIEWTFFGRRKLLWDKHAGHVQVEVPTTGLKVLLDMNNNQGMVWFNDQQQLEADTVSKYLARAKNWWINDSYWLVMPYKLKDSGVTLTYVGEDTVQEGGAAQVIELRFEGVGVTPQNKYLVYVDPGSKLVNQWAYYTNANDTVPGFVLPWEGYKEYNGIKLPSGHGMLKRGRTTPSLANVAVYTTLSPDPFAKLTPNQ